MHPIKRRVFLVGLVWSALPSLATATTRSEAASDLRELSEVFALAAGAVKALADGIRSAAVPGRSDYQDVVNVVRKADKKLLIAPIHNVRGSRRIVMTTIADYLEHAAVADQHDCTLKRLPVSAGPGWQEVMQTCERVLFHFAALLKDVHRVKPEAIDEVAWRTITATRAPLRLRARIAEPCADDELTQARSAAEHYRVYAAEMARLAEVVALYGRVVGD